MLIDLQQIHVYTAWLFKKGQKWYFTALEFTTDAMSSHLDLASLAELGRTRSRGNHPEVLSRNCELNGQPLVECRINYEYKKCKKDCVMPYAGREGNCLEPVCLVTAYLHSPYVAEHAICQSLSFSHLWLFWSHSIQSHVSVQVHVVVAQVV